MKAKIKIKRINKAIQLPAVNAKGDWIDLRAAQTVCVGRQPVTNIPLGIAVELPKGYEAIICARSSTSKKSNIWNAGALGIIDNCYNGNEDEWKFPATTIGCSETVVYVGDRICQFRIQLSQHATAWQKVKWLFTSGVEIVEVDELQGENRGGFGTSGKR